MLALSAPGSARPDRARLRLAAGAAAVAAVAWLSARGAEPFRAWTYPLAWYPLLLAADAGLALRAGPGWDAGPGAPGGHAGGPLSGRPRLALSLLLWSVPGWLLFEAANLRLANWYYVALPPSLPLRWAGAAAAFATVLPALHLAHAAADRLGFAAGWRGRGFAAGPGHRRALFALGCGFALLAAWRPRVFYPLLWGSVTLILEPLNHRLAPERSLLGDLARGRYARIARLLAAGAVVGLAWEALNSVAGARWIYTVPGLEEGKLFEMSVPGFLGFPVFALDAFVLYQTLTLLGVASPGWDGGEPSAAVPPTTPRPRRARTAAAAAAALVFSLAALAGVDRWTVDSLRPTLAEVPGVTETAARGLRAAGIRSVEGVAAAEARRVAAAAGLPASAAEEAVRFARLTTLRGIGAANARGLVAAGIQTPCALARSGEGEVVRAVRGVRRDPRAGHPPRVRVWLRAAREACRGR